MYWTNPDVSKTRQRPMTVKKHRHTDKHHLKIFLSRRPYGSIEQKKTFRSFCENNLGKEILPILKSSTSINLKWSGLRVLLSNFPAVKFSLHVFVFVRRAGRNGPMVTKTLRSLPTIFGFVNRWLVARTIFANYATRNETERIFQNTKHTSFLIYPSARAESKTDQMHNPTAKKILT